VITRLIGSVLKGLLQGLLYWLVYVVLTPYLIGRLMNIPIHVDAWFPPLAIVFIALGVVESSLSNHAISIPIRVISKLIGALCVYTLLNGGRLSSMVSRGEWSAIVYFDISPLLYTIILLNLIYGVFDVFTYYRRLYE